jgi:protein-disulfide isomerase
MSEERSIKARWQSVAETLALVLIAVTISVQAVVSRRVVAQPASAPASTPRPRPVDPPLPTEPVSLQGATLQGHKGAKVALIVYSDFQCPFCGKFERETLPALETRYVKSGQVLLAYRQFPLGFHPFAQKAAEAAECAGQQGLFWEMHDQMFEHQQQLDETSLQGYAKAVGVDGAAFKVCLAGQATASVKQDTLSGESLKVSGTPTFFVGLLRTDGRVSVAKRLSGAQPLAQFQAILDQVLSTAASAGPQ